MLVCYMKRVYGECKFLLYSLRCDKDGYFEACHYTFCIYFSAEYLCVIHFIVSKILYENVIPTEWTSVKF